MATEDAYVEGLTRHYEAFWKAKAKRHQWRAGPMAAIAPRFRVLEFSPSRRRRAWTYATVGMSDADMDSPVELHLFSPGANAIHVETLTVVAHYHRTGSRLGLGHTVNFGRPWMVDSPATHGLISLPYLDGPDLEHAHIDGIDVRCLWLVPITPEEREYKVRNGLEALEQAFETAELDYLDPHRPSVV